MRAIAFTETPDHVCGRYRVRAFEPALHQAGWSLDIQGLARGLRRVRQLHEVGDFDAVVLQRKLLPGWQLAILRRRARHLIFDFDDAVLYRDSYDPRGPHCRRRLARFQRTVQAVDLVIAGNDFLADEALRAGARSEQVRVIPTCIETDRYSTIDPKPPHPTLDLTWIGSGSTLTGLQAQGAIWDRVASDVPRARLRLICDRFPAFGGLPVVPIAWTEAGEAADLAGADVGVSWIPDDLWSQGKCGLKILQYQAAGLPAIANPVGVHPEMIRPGETGFLANSVNDWVEAIRWMDANPDERARMGRAARQSVEQDYSVRAWSTTFVGAVAGHGPVPIPKYRGATSRPIKVRDTSMSVDLPSET